MSEIILVVVVLLSMLFGFIVGRIFPTYGTLKIDHVSREKDIYRFEIDDLNKLGTKNHITLKIDHNANLSQD